MVRNLLRWPLGAVVGFLAFVVHAAAAEVWIRLTRKRCVLGVSATESCREPAPENR